MGERDREREQNTKKFTKYGRRISATCFELRFNIARARPRACVWMNAVQRYFLNLTAAHNSHSPFHRLNGNVSLVATALLSFDVKYCSLDAIN